MNIRMQLTTVATLGALIAFCSNCSRQPNQGQASSAPPKKALDERIAALANQSECPVLGEEIHRMLGTNSQFAIHLQRVLNNNKRLAATGPLLDVVETGGKVEAIFEISEWQIDTMCIARLECPTNLIPKLTSIAPNDLWGFVFEVRETQQSLNFSNSSKDEAVSHVRIVLTIEGRLIAVEEPD